jgi:hypothetical protein
MTTRRPATGNTFCTLLFVVLIILSGCRKKDPPPPPDEEPVSVGTADVSIEFVNEMNGSALVFNKYYLTPNGDSLSVYGFAYYISNVVLTREDNGTHKVPESYFIVRHPAQRVMVLKNVPAARYKSVSFTLGVDSARNTSGAQTGGLDPVYAGDMYWNWNSGYVFFKLEGTSPQSGDPSRNVGFHIGGYGGPNKAQRSFTLVFGSSSLFVSDGKQPGIVLRTELSESLKSPSVIDLKTNYSQLGEGPGAKTIADNYADMITFISLQN